MKERTEQLAASAFSAAGLIAALVPGGIEAATILLFASTAFGVVMLAQQAGRQHAAVGERQWLSSPAIAIVAALLLAASVGAAYVPVLTQYPLPGLLAALGCGAALLFGGYRDGIAGSDESANWSLLATAAAIGSAYYPYRSFARTADGIFAVLAVLLMFARAIRLRAPTIQ